MASHKSQPVDPGSRRFIAASMSAPFLERDHELELARRWRERQDTAALHELVLSYARFAVRIAAGFRGYGLPFGDLIQEANIGLMQAAARFDPERNVRFSTYASWWVAAAIQEYILRNSSIVRIGTTAAQKSLFFGLRRLRAQLANNPNGPMTDEDRKTIAKTLEVPLAAVERMEAHISAPDQSLNAPIGSPEGDEFQNFLPDNGPNPEEIAIATLDGAIRAGWIEDALHELSPREREIIANRFLSDDPSTLAELGEVFGVSKERVRQIEARALDKMRDCIGQNADERRDLVGG